MTDIHRYYECGCAPDDEQFCKLMDGFVWAERDAIMDWSGMYGEPSPELEAAANRRATVARVQMRIHLGWQEATGRYEDVDLDALPVPEDDGYDEDPRQVGYPS